MPVRGKPPLRWYRSGGFFAAVADAPMHPAHRPTSKKRSRGAGKEAIRPTTNRIAKTATETGTPSNPAV